MSRAMNTTNQIFNWKRFTAALRKEVVENKRQLILVLLSIFLFFTVFMVLGNIISNEINTYSSEDEEMMEELMPSIFIMSVYSFLVIIVASLAFRNLTSKTGRVMLFTSPSSMTEKFIVNLVIYVVGAFVAFLVCAQLADLARIVVLTPFKSKTFGVPGPMNFFSSLFDSSSNALSINNIFEESDINESSMKIMVILSIFLAPAIYFMGSVLWPRLSLLKTFAAQQVLNGIVSFIVLAIFAAPFLYGLSKDNLTKADASSLMNSINVSNYISYAIALICWYGAWYLFKRKDVVSLKWWK